MDNDRELYHKLKTMERELCSGRSEVESSPLKKEGGGWTSVMDRMPEDEFLYIVLVDGEKLPYMAWYDGDNWMLDTTSNEDVILDDITYWMPIPSPPEEK